jgi:hypothetical protein
MGDMINRFLSGKKKYSVFIATFLTSAITMAVSDPQQAQELQEFVPMLAMLISGVAYLIVEGWNDSRRTQTEAAYYNMLTAQHQAQAGGGERAGRGNTTTTTAPAEPFDEARFINSIHTGAVELARTAFPDAPQGLQSIYRAAEAIGQKTLCHDIREALAYWDYLSGLAEDAWKQLEFDNKDERGCKLHPPELYEFRATVNRVNSCYEKLQALVRSGGDWRRLSSPIYGLTVYSVGAFAGEGVGE